MKKIFALLLALVMIFSLVACGNNEKPVDQDAVTTAPTVDTEATEDAVLNLNDTEDILLDLFNKCPMQFSVMTWAIETTDTEAVKAYTGLDNADKIEEIAVTEPAMSAQAYSVVLVKVKDAAAAEAVAEEMKNGVNPAKWVCVQADDMDIAICDNYVLLAMLSSDFAEFATANEIANAFRALMGAPAEGPSIEVEVPAATEPAVSENTENTENTENVDAVG